MIMTIYMITQGCLTQVIHTYVCMYIYTHIHIVVVVTVGLVAKCRHYLEQIKFKSMSTLHDVTID